MMALKGLLVVVSLFATQSAGYKLNLDFLAGGPANFFEQFTFFDAPDPTHGQQAYIDYTTASQNYLIGHMKAAHEQDPQAKSVYIGLGSNAGNTHAVRISSKASFSPGTLLLADIAHMPTGCGTWPAMWLLGSGVWPAGGEIDIIENVNSNNTNQMTLHTGPGCSISNGNHKAYSGTVVNNNYNCQSGGNNDAGCGILAPADSQTFGPVYNQQGGGLWAMEWTTTDISIWYKPRSSGQIPSILSNKSPNPSALFGKPLARFDGSGCNFATSFKDMNLVFNTALCGDWAGQDDVWDSSSCSKTFGASCEAYVAHADLSDAFWLINALRIYT